MGTSCFSGSMSELPAADTKNNFLFRLDDFPILGQTMLEVKVVRK